MSCQSSKLHEKDGNSRLCAEDCVCTRQKKTQSEINALMGGRNCNDSSSQFENTIDSIFAYPACGCAYSSNYTCSYCSFAFAAVYLHEILSVSIINHTLLSTIIGQ